MAVEGLDFKDAELEALAAAMELLHKRTDEKIKAGTMTKGEGAICFLVTNSGCLILTLGNFASAQRALIGLRLMQQAKTFLNEGAQTDGSVAYFIGDELLGGQFQHVGQTKPE